MGFYHQRAASLYCANRALALRGEIRCDIDAEQRIALPLALGTGCLMVIAGVIEGWISPLPIGWSTNAVIGGRTTSLVLFWLALGGRVTPGSGAWSSRRTSS